MGHKTHKSTNVKVKETHNKDITQINNNVENEINRYTEHNTEVNTLNGHKAYGGAVYSNGDANYGTAIYKLVNLNSLGLYNTNNWNNVGDL